MTKKLRAVVKAIQNLGPLQTIVYEAQRFRVRKRPPQGTYRLLSKHALYPLHCRPRTSDKSVFMQIFVDREYRCLDNVAEAGLIIDCGANAGYSSAYFLSRYPSATVISVEPDPGNFALVQLNLAPYGARSTAVCAGVWSKKTGLVMSERAWGDNREWARTVRECEGDEMPAVEAVDIGSLLAASGFDRISILKIDIEGSELEVFSSNYSSWIGKVDNIVIELHGEACTAAFMEAIRGQNFDISTCDELTVCQRRPEPPHMP